MSSPHSLHDSMVRARSKSDPLGLRAGLPTVPGQQQPLQQQEAPPAGPADGAPRIQGRSLDEALRTLRQMQQQQPAGLWGSGLGGRLDEVSTCTYQTLLTHGSSMHMLVEDALPASIACCCITLPNSPWLQLLSFALRSLQHVCLHAGAVIACNHWQRDAGMQWAIHICLMITCFVTVCAWLP